MSAPGESFKRLALSGVLREHYLFWHNREQATSADPLPYIMTGLFDAGLEPLMEKWPATREERIGYVTLSIGALGMSMLLRTPEIMDRNLPARSARDQADDVAAFQLDVGVPETPNLHVARVVAEDLLDQSPEDGADTWYHSDGLLIHCAQPPQPSAAALTEDLAQPPHARLYIPAFYDEFVTLTPHPERPPQPN